MNVFSLKLKIDQKKNVCIIINSINNVTIIIITVIITLYTAKSITIMELFVKLVSLHYKLHCFILFMFLALWWKIKYINRITINIVLNYKENCLQVMNIYIEIGMNINKGGDFIPFIIIVLTRKIISWLFSFEWNIRTYSVKM